MTPCIVESYFLCVDPQPPPITRKSARLINPHIPWVALIYCGISISDSFNIIITLSTSNCQYQRKQLHLQWQKPPRCIFCFLVYECVFITGGMPVLAVAWLLALQPYPLANHFLTPTILSWLPLFFLSFWQAALQLLLPPSPYCLTAFLSFLLASCD